MLSFELSAWILVHELCVIFELIYVIFVLFLKNEFSAIFGSWGYFTINNIKDLKDQHSKRTLKMWVLFKWL